MTDNSQTYSSIEEILGAFSAIANDGLILMLGDTPLQYQKAVLSGMSALGRLVINLPEQSVRTRSEDLSQSDLRVAVHCQDSCEFLHDVKQHRLSMVVVHSQDINETLFGQVASMLLDGGVLIVISSANSDVADFANKAGTFRRANLGSCELFVKITKPLRSRRGGRKTKVLSQ